MSDKADVTDDPARGVFGISVAAELTGLGVQNLRAYERYGLLEPARTDGGTRRYSSDDLTRLRRIRALLEQGLNLAGIAQVLGLETANADLRAELAERPAPTRKR
jgi:DNA-binding transcriptional MerR regulator